MKNIEREQIKRDYIERVFKKSWTYEKLTDKEKKNIIDLLYETKLYGNKDYDIVNELHFIYTAFLLALDYNPTNWRETEEEKETNPTF